MTWNGSVPQARTHDGSGDEPAAGSDHRIESAARDLAFSAELATMGLIPSEDVTELPAPLPAAPEPAAMGQVSDRIDAYLPKRTRPGVARRSPFSAGPRLSRALRPLGAALRRTVLEPSLAADVRRDRELATGLRATTPGCRRVLVLSAGPGCGQTSAAALIALTLSRVRDDRVAAVDLDADSTSLASVLGQPQAPTAGDVLRAARRARQGGAFSPRLGSNAPLAVLRMEGQGADQIEEAMEALLTVERGVAVTVVDPGFSPRGFLLDRLLAGTQRLVVVAPANNLPLAERLLDDVAARGPEVSTDTAIILRCGEQAAVRRRSSSAEFMTVLTVPRDDMLAAAAVIDLAALRPGTRRAVVNVSLAVMADRSRPAAPAER